VHTVSSSELGSDRWNNLLQLADELDAGWILDNGELPVEPAPGWTEVVRYTDNGWTLLKRT
jgi:hypothetical protein